MAGVSGLNSGYPQSAPLWAFAGEDLAVFRFACVISQPLFEVIFNHFQVPRNNLNDSNVGAFGGPIARATRAWRPLHGSPWVLRNPCCHQMITQTHPTGNRRILEKVKLSKFFSRHHAQAPFCPILGSFA